jgi:O-antigen/teichoic acid export membrane protein
MPRLFRKREARSSQVFLNLLSSYGVQLAASAVGLLLFPFLSNRLGLRTFGLYLILTSTAQLIVQGDLGLGTSLIRDVAAQDRASAGGTRRLNSLISTTLYAFVVAGTILGVIYFAVVAVLWDHIAGDIHGARLIYAALPTLSGLMIAMPAGVFRQALAGFGRLDRANRVTTFQILMRSVLIVGVLSASDNLLALLAVDAVVSVAGGVLAFGLCRKTFPELSVSLALADRGLLREMLPYSWKVFLISISGVIILQTDSLIIGALASASAVAIYNAAFRLFVFAREIAGAALQAVVPLASRAHAAGDRGKLIEVSLRFTKYSNMVACCIAVPLLAFAPQIIHVWLGPKFQGAVAPLQLLMLALLVSNNHAVFLGVLIGTGELRWITRLQILWAVSNLVLTAALVIPLGIAGAALGTLAPVVFLEPVYSFLMARTLKARFALLVFETWLRSFAVAGPPAVLLYLVGRSLPTTAILPAVALSCAYLAVFGLAACSSLGMSSLERLRVFQKVGLRP